MFILFSLLPHIFSFRIIGLPQEVHSDDLLPNIVLTNIISHLVAFKKNSSIDGIKPPSPKRQKIPEEKDKVAAESSSSGCSETAEESVKPAIEHAELSAQTEEAPNKKPIIAAEPMAKNPVALMNDSKQASSQEFKKTSARQPAKRAESRFAECPICLQHFLSSYINQHVEQCLEKSDRAAKQKAATSTLELAKPSPASRESKEPQHLALGWISGFSVAQLKKELTKYKLPTHGTKEAMQKRIKDFILQYNAECDSKSTKHIITHNGEQIIDYDFISKKVMSHETVNERAERRMLKEIKPNYCIFFSLLFSFFFFFFFFFFF